MWAKKKKNPLERINRAMALCISLMFGRLGGIVGSNLVALLLDSHCEMAFYLAGTSLLGKLYLM